VVVYDSEYSRCSQKSNIFILCLLIQNSKHPKYNWGLDNFILEWRLVPYVEIYNIEQLVQDDWIGRVQQGLKYRNKILFIKQIQCYITTVDLIWV
jgi:hypothetical protein